MSDEILDNLEEEGSFRNIRKPYFDLLERLIVVENFVLIIFALQNMYSIGFPLENLLEELVIISAASFSIFYIYRCHKITLSQNKTNKPPFPRFFHFISFLVALSFTSGLSFEIFNVLSSNDNGLSSPDWFMLFIFSLFWTVGVCQCYYTNIMSTKL